MNTIQIVPEERKKILENPDLILLDKELMLALIKDSDFPHQGNLSPLKVPAIIPCPVELSLDFLIFFVALLELFQFYSYIFLNYRLTSFFPVSRKLA